MSIGNEEYIIEAQKLSFAYDGHETPSLNGLSLQIRKGEKVAFMGANGSGKSTFFLCCNGIHRPNGGRLLFHGKEISYTKKELKRLRSKVGLVFQDPDNQLLFASVYQEISFGIMNLGVEESIARKRVDEILRKLGITLLCNRPTHELSGGEKKQVSIADILVMDPDVMILDEPTAALDPKHVEYVNQCMERLSREGVTIMLAIHDIDYAYEWADQIVLMSEGRILAKGDPLSICSNEELLLAAGLSQPTVLKLFYQLKGKGIFQKNLEPPISMKQLEYYIETLA